jgi:serine/threonine-protein kinase
MDLCPACLITTVMSVDEPCPYQVLAPIGDDSGGVTYLAQALTGARGYVALKILGPRDDADAAVSRYRDWKPALARLQHPSIGKLLDVDLTAEGLLYVASEYVAGWPLTALDSHASLGMDERIEIGRQLTGALDAAHAEGVVHLKLDPSRVKISTANGPRATILGFGTSLIIDGASGQPDLDRLALARIIRELGV